MRGWGLPRGTPTALHTPPELCLPPATCMSSKVSSHRSLKPVPPSCDPQCWGSPDRREHGGIWEAQIWGWQHVIDSVPLTSRIHHATFLPGQLTMAYVSLAPVYSAAGGMLVT